MKKINKYIVVIALFFITKQSFSQLEKYSYQADINNVSDTWHTLKLPLQAYSLINKNYTDIRIYGLSDTDTIEVPYIKEIFKDKITRTESTIEIINRSKSSKGSYFTISNKAAEEINEIEFVFKENNFDWYLTLEGSNDNENWFVVAENERIVSLKKNTVNFKATKVKFPTINYKYIRVLVNHVNNLNLLDALIYNNTIVKGEEVIHTSLKQSVEEQKESKKTQISVHLKEKLPVSKVIIPIQSDVDYYRKIHIKTLRDSIVLENKIKYNYTNIGFYEISSYEKNEIQINSIITDNFVIEIENLDNQPLAIGKITMSGNPVFLKARFPKEKLRYVLAVGNDYERVPNYDITGFTNTIPKDLKQLSINDFIAISKKEIKEKGPVLPFPKYILWIVLILIVVILGFFTFKMFKK